LKLEDWLLDVDDFDHHELRSDVWNIIYDHFYRRDVAAGMLAAEKLILEHKAAA